METNSGRISGATQRQYSDEMDQCVTNCTECVRTCLETVSHCLKMGGEHAEADHITLLLNCVSICRTSAEFMITESPLHVHTCAACAAVCESCAESCTTKGNEDFMRRCAEVCGRCAESCGRMSAQ